MHKFLLISVTASLLVAGGAAAELADGNQARQVCENWLTFIVDSQGDWAGATEPRVAAVDEIFHNNTLMGYCFSVEPVGYVLVPVLRELAPINASSQTSRFDPQAGGGFSLLVRENLYDRFQQYENLYGEPATGQPGMKENPFAVRNREAWNRFLVGGEEFEATLHDEKADREATVGPLMTTAWHQGPPYNDFCPIGDDGLCIVGCVATAMAQIMVYHGWPTTGEGHHQYNWSGDGSCGGVPRGDVLTADFDDTYEWDLMPDVCNNGSPQRVKDAVAELCYETGISVDMDYGCCWSGTNLFYAQTSMPEYFRYQDVAVRDDRSDHTPETWFTMLKAEVNRGLPVLYGISLAAGGGHAMVCDGWRDVGGIDQIHINYGWADGHTTWYSLDDIYISADPRSETMLRNIIPGQGVASVHRPGVGDPAQVSLSASPNPFNPQTTIRYGLPMQATVTLRIFDLAGRLVDVLVEGEDQAAGTHIATWAGRDSRGWAMPSGAYFCRLEAGDYTETKRITLLK